MKTIIITILFLIALLFSACSPSAPLPASEESSPPVSDRSSPQPLPPGSSDEWALWSNGTQLRGANIYQREVIPDLDGDEFMGISSFGPPYTQADFDALSALGANYVNLSVAGVYTINPPYEVNETAVANLDALLEMIANADMFAVITFRSGPGRSDFTILRDGAGVWYDEDLLVESVWEDADARAAWAEMWRFTAERYLNNPIVVGYDLMCEPNTNDFFGIWDQTAFMEEYGGTGYDWNTWYPSLVEAIRSVDTETPILVGGNGYSNPDWLITLQPIDADRIVYTFHQYEPHEYTHREAYATPVYAYPGHFDTNYDDQAEDFNLDWLSNWLAAVAERQGEMGAPLAANEYGVMRWQAGAAEFLRDEMNMFDSYGWNYAVWCWEASWRPWSESVTDFNFLYGPDPANNSQTPNDLLDALTDAWARNTLRPSNYP